MTLAFAPPDGETSWLNGGLDTELPCRQYDPDLWFADAPADLEVAKALCGGCPLRAECLAGAIERAEPWGVWGGEIFERGVVVARKRPRGRPRKEDLARDVGLNAEVAQRMSPFFASDAKTPSDDRGHAARAVTDQAVTGRRGPASDARVA